MRAVAAWLLAGATGLVAAPAGGAWFAEATSRLGKPQPCGGSGCYSNYVLMADLDGDGHLDLAFANGGGYYVPGKAEPLAIYRNDGKGHFTEMGATALGGFAGRLRQIAAGDVDGDGDLDLVALDSWAMQPDALFINQGSFVFKDEGASRLGTSSRSAGARFGDVDGDGDLDLVATDWGSKPYTSKGTARVYRNDGKGFFVEAAGAVPQGTQAIGSGPIDLDLFDADGDFDLDLVLANRKGESLLFRNDGNGQFADANADLPDQPGPYVYGPDACDVDGDGDLDLWLDNGGDKLAEQLLTNSGQGVFTDVSKAQISGNPNADDNEVQCADLDDDGDFDAVIASLSDQERTLLNDGKGFFALAKDTFTAASDSTLGLDLGDVDGDGRLDAVTAQGEGGDFTNRLYLGAAEQAQDTRAPVVRAAAALPSEITPGQLLVRFALADRTTTDLGPRAKAWVAVKGPSDTKVEVPARFVGGDLFRAAVDLNAPGVYALAICATDTAGNVACGTARTVTVVGQQPAVDAAGTDAAGPDVAQSADGPAMAKPDAAPAAVAKPADSGCGTNPAGQGRAWTACLGALAAACRFGRRRAPS